MDLIPQDIWPLMANFMDRKTKRQMRLANTAWFNIIKFNYFKAFFTRAEDIPAITERLAKYSWPIKLKFAKPKFANPLELIDHLPQLTNLIRLHADALDIQGEEGEQVSEEQWLRLRVLTNLQMWTPMPDAAPVELWKNLTNLVEWLQTGAEEFLTPILSQMPKLRRLYNFEQSLKTWPFALVPNPENLTALRVQGANEENFEREGQEMWSRLGNVREMGYYEDSANKIELQYLTALRTLDLYSASLPSLAANTNLVCLTLSCADWPQSAAESLANLKNIEELDIMFFQNWPAEEVAHQFNFLSQLTKLETLKLNNHNGVPQGIMRELIQQVYPLIPGSVKEIRIDAPCDLEKISHLTNLESLSAVRSTTNSQHVTALTNLRRLFMEPEDFDHVGVVSQLTQLRELIVGTESYDDADFPNLENLVNLTKLMCIFQTYPTEKMAALQNLTNLESLSVNGSKLGISTENCDFLHGLTKLTHLVIDAKVEYMYTLWQNLTKLTNLRHVTVPEVHNDEELLFWDSFFTNLTSLKIVSGGENFTGVYLTQLTSLQTLECGPSENLVYDQSTLMKLLPHLVECYMD